LLFGELKFAAQGPQHFATAGVPNPTAYLVGLSAVIGTGPIKHRASVAGGQGGDLGGEKIAEEAASVIETKMFAVFRRRMAGGTDPADEGTVGRRLRAQNCSGGPIAKEAGADENAGVVIEITGGGTDFHADHEDPAGASCLELCSGLVQGREGSPAALTHEIEQRGLTRKPEGFGDVAREAGAEVAGAGGNEKSIDLIGRKLGIFQSLLGGLGGEIGGVFPEAGHHGVRTKIEGFPHLVQGEVATLNAVFAGEDLAEQVAGFLRQGGEGGIHLEGLEHLGLGEGSSRNGEAEGVDEHGWWKAGGFSKTTGYRL
jgi:hypothetical protein